MRPRARFASDSGAFAILYGLVVVSIVMTAAVVVDLSSLREDRRAARLATDAAATAGAVKLNALAGSANAQAACQEAWRFLRANLPDSGSASANCPTGSFPTTFTVCPTDVRTASGVAGPWNITITWPVPDDNSLMTEPNVTGLGAYRQPIDPEVDGMDRCGRLGVTVERTRDFVFAGAGGFVDATTANSSVARAELRGQVNLEMPLVVLDQSGCQSLYATGAGTLIEVSNNGITPGRIAMDSSGTLAGNPYPGCDNSNQYVAMRNGLGATIRALNGTSGAPGMLFTVAEPIAKAATAADLCALGTDPSTVTGICPRPTTLFRITRKYWDWKYHCTSTTTEPLSAACPYSTSDYIQQLRSTYNPSVVNAGAVGTNPAWQVISGAACTVNAPVTYTSALTYVNCPNFQVRATTVFERGVVVFAGNVDVSGGASANGCLRFNYTRPATGDAPCAINPANSSVNTAVTDMTVYLQNGNVTRSNLDFVAPQTFIYQEASAAAPYSSNPNRFMDFGVASSGAILITAPTTGNFEDLAIWTENCGGRRDANSVCPGTAQPNQINKFGASTNLILEGIFFFPNGRVTLAGQPSYFGAARSQFVSWSLEVAGGAQLRLIPDPNRTLTIPVGGVRLIR